MIIKSAIPLGFMNTFIVPSTDQTGRARILAEGEPCFGLSFLYHRPEQSY